MSSDESTPLLIDKMGERPNSPFTSGYMYPDGIKRPQAIAHRGYKKAWPENTMGAFKGAVEVGSHAIETDIHLSKDGVVVISHDADLKRCFGEKDKIIDCDWSHLQTLQTLKEPHQPMPRLKDLLEYLNEPGLEDIWLLLDIKMDNDSDDVMRLIASTLNEVKEFSKPWTERVLLGVWATKYLPLCAKYLPGYSIAYIGFSIEYARQFLPVPNTHFNMLQQVIAGPGGNCFLRDVRKANRSIFLWTVNEERTMKWCISKGVDGVITDDPKTYLEVSKKYKGEKVWLSFRALASVVWVQIMIIIFGPMFWRKVNSKTKKEQEAESVEAARISA